MSDRDREHAPLPARVAVAVLLAMVLVAGLVLLLRQEGGASGGPAPTGQGPDGSVQQDRAAGLEGEAPARTEAFPPELAASSRRPWASSRSALVIGRVVDDLLLPVDGCEVVVVAMDPVYRLARPRPQTADETAVLTGADGRFQIRIPADLPHVLALRTRDVPLQVVMEDLVLPASTTRTLGDLPLHGRPGLTVQVHDSLGRPLPGARVELIPLAGAHGGIAALLDRPESRRISLTDETGQAQLAGVLPTKHRLRVDAAGHASHEQTYQHQLDTWQKTVVSLSPGLTLRGRVLALEDHGATPLTVEAELPGEDRTERAEVARDGSYRITGLRAGRLKLWLEGPALGRHLAAELDLQSEASHFDLRLPPLPVLRGRVVSETGLPLAAAIVRQLVPFEAGARGAMATTRPDGSFSLSVPAGETHVEVHLEGRPKATYGPFHAPQENLLLTLWQGLTLEGRLVDPEGAPVVSALVELLPAGHDGSAYAELLLQAGGGPGATTRTGVDGAYRLAGLAAGRYRLRLTAAGLAVAATPPFQIEQGRTRLDLGSQVLHQGTVVQGTARDQGGQPRSWAAVRIEAIDAIDGFLPSFQVTTDGQGQFQTRPLRPGRYRFCLLPGAEGDLTQRAIVIGTSLKEVQVPAQGPCTVDLTLEQ